MRKETPQVFLSFGDATKFLKYLEDESIDMVFTDPAYQSLDKHRSVGTTTRLKKAWFPTVANDEFNEYFNQISRVLKPNSACFIMCDSDTMFAIKPIGEKYMKFWKPIVWNKMSRGMGYHFPAQTEFILYFEKGKRKLNKNSTHDFISIPEMVNYGIETIEFEEYNQLTLDDFYECKRIRSSYAYPTEKPVELIEKFILEASNEGDWILDFMMGSGSTMEAAIKHGRSFIGCDLPPTGKQGVANSLPYVLDRLVRLYREGYNFTVTLHDISKSCPNDCEKVFKILEDAGIDFEEWTPEEE